MLSWRCLIPTVQGSSLHPAYRRLIGEPLAGRPKSRRESGQNTPILQFSYFGRLFQPGNAILVDKRLAALPWTECKHIGRSLQSHSISHQLHPQPFPQWRGGQPNGNSISRCQCRPQPRSRMTKLLAKPSAFIFKRKPSPQDPHHPPISSRDYDAPLSPTSPRSA
jgi:hypothetical protein